MSNTNFVLKEKRLVELKESYLWSGFTLVILVEEISSKGAKTPKRLHCCHPVAAAPWRFWGDLPREHAPNTIVTHTELKRFHENTNNEINLVKRIEVNTCVKEKVRAPDKMNE